jgi:hypothetical protein
MMMRMSGKSLPSTATNHQQAMDAHENHDEIVNDIYRHTENFMHKSSMAMQPDYVGKPEDLYLWCSIWQLKTCWEYCCPMSYSCGCNTGITETKQTLTLETISVHDRHSHTGGKMHASKSTPGVGGFFRSVSEGSANDESIWWSAINISYLLPSRSDITLSSQ